MDILLLAGRILYGAYFLILGASYIRNTPRLMRREGLRHLPYPGIIVYICSALAILGGLGVVLGFHPSLALGAIILMLVFTSLRLHDYWNADSPETIAVEMSHFLKNIALIGAALMMYSILTPWPFTL